MPAEFSRNALVRYAFVATRTKSPALVSRIRRVRIVSRAMISLPPSSGHSVVEGNADDRPQVTQLAALFRVAGDVHFALGRAMTDEAGGRVVFGDHDSESGAIVGVDDRGIRLSLGPLGIEQLGLDGLGLPGIRPCP